MVIVERFLSTRDRPPRAENAVLKDTPAPPDLVSMPVYRILVEYDGSHFHGWQIQPGKATVQGALESAVHVACREHARIVGSGRTDAGVHARGQVAHLQLRRSVDPHRLKRSLNGILGGTVAVLDVAEAEDGFHARYDARLRRYHYYVTTEPRVLDRHVRWHVMPEPDFENMNAASAHFVGTHNFDAFCRTQSSTVNRRCAVRTACWQREHRPGDWYFRVEADRFLHGMVRTMVGTLIEIGHGKRLVDSISELLLTGDRRTGGPAAPAHALVLEAVEY